MSITESLEVYLGEVRVGLLAQRSYRVSLTLADSYLEMNQRPVLGQWFEDRLRQGPFMESHGGLPAFFENLLPADELRRLIKVQHHLDEATDLDLLGVVGQDLAGATVLRDPRDEAPVGFEDLSEIDVDVPAVSPGLRFSLAGLQLKFSLIKQGRVLTLPSRGSYGRWIAKVPVLHAPAGIVQNEYSIMRWASEAGFDVPVREILQAADLHGLPERLDQSTPVYVIERFDRERGGRVHQEDFAQIIGIMTEDAVSSNVAFGHGGLGRLVGQLLGRSGLEEYLRRLALVVGSGNEDAHIKNWAILYRNGRTPSWAPLYDQVATVVWRGGRDRGPSLPLASTKIWEDLDLHTLTDLAAEIGIEPAVVSAIFDEVLARLRETWSSIQHDLPMLPEHRQALADHWTRVPLLRRMGRLGP
ncbi:MAG: HipA domain-containing protein [Nannocystaceae bacterium]